MSILRKKSIIDICFRIYGDNLDPEDITHILNIKPTLKAKKGEESIIKKTGKKVYAKTGKWFLDTEEYVDSTRVNDHIEFVLNLLRDSSTPLQDIKAVEHVTITFIIGVDENTDTVEFDLKPDLLKEIILQNIELSFAII